MSLEGMNQSSMWTYGEHWNTMGPLHPQAVHVNTFEQQPTASNSSHSRTQGPQPDGFAHWLHEQGFSAATIDILMVAGFSSKMLLQNMLPEDIAALKVEPLAQRRLLETCLKTLQPVRPSQPSSSVPAANSPAPGAKTDEMLQSLQNLLTPSLQQDSTGEASMSYVPPFALAGGKKHLDITDFVRCFSSPTEHIIANDSNMQVLIRGGSSSKPKLDDITPLAWLGGSIRIMRELVRRGDLKASEIDHYLVYLEKISDLSGKYTWASLRTYDREYRRWQAQTGAPWTRDNGHLSDAFLHVRQDGTQQSSSKPSGVSTSKTQKNSKQSTGMETCRSFNFGKCKFGDQCKFQHICMVAGCQQNHPVTQHGAPKNVNPTQ